MSELKEFHVLLLDKEGTVFFMIPVLAESATIALCRAAILAHDLGADNFDIEVPPESASPLN